MERIKVTIKNFMANENGISEVLSEALILASTIALFTIAVIQPVTNITTKLSDLWKNLQEGASGVGETIYNGLSWIAEKLKEAFSFS